MPVIHTPSVDIRHAAFMATLAGGLLWAMANGYAVICAPIWPGNAAVVRCLAESVLGVATACIFGIFISPGVCIAMNIREVQLVSVVCVAIGFGAWIGGARFMKLITSVTFSRATLIKALLKIVGALQENGGVS